MTNYMTIVGHKRIILMPYAQFILQNIVKKLFDSKNPYSQKSVTNMHSG